VCSKAFGTRRSQRGGRCLTIASLGRVLAAHWRGHRTSLSWGWGGGCFDPRRHVLPGWHLDSLVDEVYDDLGRFTDSQSHNEHIIQRTILTPLNEDVDNINTAIMNRFDLTTPDGTLAQRRMYHNVDSVVQGKQRGVYLTEFLNSLSMSRVPPHTLTL